MPTLSALSPAKLNLFLNVIGKNEHNYHLLESLFIKLQLADEITVEPADDILVTTSSNTVILDNIVTRTAKLLSHTYNYRGGVHINICKNIPIGAGLGGASSNSATTLLLLNQLWNLNLTDVQLTQHALRLGADVPFFLKAGNAMVYGTGEIIETVKLDIKLPIILIYPNFPISTAEVYQQSVQAFSPTQQPLSIQQIIFQIYNGHNDLYIPALRLHPMISQVISTISAQPGCIAARMSGSGSCCFGIFNSTEAAYITAHNFITSGKDWFVYHELLQL